MSVNDYIKNLSSALRGSGAHELYFPMNVDARKAGLRQLAKEFGYGLADSPKEEVDREIGSAYSQLVVMHCLDSVGVQIDAKEFVTIAREAESQQRKARALYERIQVDLKRTDEDDCPYCEGTWDDHDSLNCPGAMFRLYVWRVQE